jgi:hypothetical protein
VSPVAPQAEKSASQTWPLFFMAYAMAINALRKRYIFQIDSSYNISEIKKAGPIPTLPVW